MQSRGKADSRALDPRPSAYRANSIGESEPLLRDGDSLSLADSIAALDGSLSTSPVDLARIAEEMHAHPQFAGMVMRLASSLLVSPEKSAMTIEEAVVALGTDRLRALLEIWTRFRLRPDQNLAHDPKSQTPRMANDRLSVLQEAGSLTESIYLATFLRDIGSDSGIPSIASISACLLAAISPSAEFPEFCEFFREDVLLSPHLRAGGRETRFAASGSMRTSDGKERA